MYIAPLRRIIIPKMNKFDIAIIGAGAAGMMAGIWAAKTNPKLDILLIDGAKKLGAKILVSGGGRCNITNRYVSANDYGGGSRNAIKKVLQEFTADETISFFNQLNVQTKEEPLGKIFPLSNSAKDIVKALLAEINKLGIVLQHPYRVGKVNYQDNQFMIMSDDNQPTVYANKLILATGGRALPKSGSDGKGYLFTKQFGHSLTKNIFPALVPLTLENNNFLLALKGITLPTKLSVNSPLSKKKISFGGSTLITHFGLSGPSVLNISRYYIAAKNESMLTELEMNFLPEIPIETFEKTLTNSSKQIVSSILKNYLPQRLGNAILKECGIPDQLPVHQLPKAKRKKLLMLLFRYPLPITGNRGYAYAEVTAGGIPLTEITLKSMESRIQENLFLCGEILDVDGKIGGYNFQWAWSSGVIAGRSAAAP
jgi:predicted Rossmann fold flavoprotein